MYTWGRGDGAAATYKEAPTAPQESRLAPQDTAITEN